MPSGFRRTLAWLGFTREGSATVAPSRPTRSSFVSPERALTLSTLYRGIGIHATAASQLSMDVLRGRIAIATVPSIVEQPDVNMTRAEFYEYYVVSQYLRGESFIRLTLADATAGARAGGVVNMECLNPLEVEPHEEPKTRRVDYYNYRGENIPASQMIHKRFLIVPGRVHGLGPIQAAMEEIAGALDARDYGSSWFSESKQPDGILTTDQELKPGDSEQYRNVWYGRNADGSPRVDSDGKPIPASDSERLRVMGKGLTYTQILLKPSEVQFLDSQQFSTTQMARLLGLTPGMMLAATDGNASTYSNIQQEWIGYVRFGLMKALVGLEDAFSAILPRGTRAKVNLDDLYRMDQKTRYDGYKIALDPLTGWMDLDEVRALEGLAPMTDAQRQLRKESQPPAVPSKEPADAQN